ncbi:hypothetical protein LWI28_019099 [Acer negundo]|uniref:Major facilitator superfamily (MFS) profile domain-containing protein n=1 Tax=Acer negundo TaxID=4023 RepID=A0AAD5IEW9_ACENE|nr:hypothetical protein LWI28_019099 [Acer negundo]KAK4839816.1 hypothetical protein QYF36_025223 [Acer negundo]
MADNSLPLLSQSQSHSDQRQETHNHDDKDNNNVVTKSLDDMIEQSIGCFGWAQFVQAILVALASVFDSQQSFINVYTDSHPTWHCTSTSNTTCNATVSNICELSKSDWAWDGASSESIITEWGLECSSAFIRSLPASSHFTGCLLGILFVSTLADSSLGRKNLLLLSCLIMSFTTFIIILSSNVWIYSLLRFISGVARASIGTCVIVLLTEKIGKRWRGLSGVIDATFFVIGTLSLPAIAYISGDHQSSWRAMYLWTSIPSIVYCALLYFFVSESPRWLLMQCRVVEAIATLKRLSPNNGNLKLNQDSYEFAVHSSTHNDQTFNKFNVFSSIGDLFNKKWIRKRTLAIMVLGFGIGTVYYGMTFGNGNAGVVFNGLSELPSVLMIFYLIKSLNRRSSMLLLCVTSGICCILTAVVSNEFEMIQFGLKVGSFFGSCTGLNVILIYSIELFPTCVRNSATSMARQALNFGAIFSSILVSAVGNKNEFVSNVVFGLIIICCGFSVVFLPETKDASLCDTMDEQERKDNVVV